MSTIEHVRTRRLIVPLHTPFVTALRRTTTVETVLVEVVDSDGVSGWGEAPQVWQVTGDSLAGSQACLDGPLSDALIGAPSDPRFTASVIQRTVVANRSAKMAADIALHDLAARRAGVPLAQHLATYVGLGIAASRVRTDVTLAAGDAGSLAAAAQARVADGFEVLKLKVGTDAATDVARVKAVREAVGPGVALRLDANQGWDAFSAIAVIHALEDAGVAVEVVEQPVAAADLIGLAHVTANVDTPVMADESLFTLEDLVEIIRLDAADLVNVKLAKCGGLTRHSSCSGSRGCTGSARSSARCWSRTWASAQRPRWWRQSAPPPCPILTPAGGRLHRRSRAVRRTRVTSSCSVPTPDSA